MEKKLALACLYSENENSPKQAIIFTEDSKIYIISSQSQLKRLMTKYTFLKVDEMMANLELIELKSSKRTRIIDCNPKKNPALARIFVDLCNFYFKKLELEDELGKLAGTNVKWAYLLSCLNFGDVEFDKDIDKNSIQDKEIPIEVMFNEEPFCTSCEGLEPYTPTITLNTGTFCLKCCGFPIGEGNDKKRIRLAIKRKGHQLRSNYYFRRMEEEEEELELLPK